MGVVDIVLGSWFDPSKTITRTAVIESGVVADVERVAYRIEVEMAEGPPVIEQVAYYSQEHGRISELRLVCSGFRPYGRRRHTMGLRSARRRSRLHRPGISDSSCATASGSPSLWPYCSTGIWL